MIRKTHVRNRYGRAFWSVRGGCAKMRKYLRLFSIIFTAAILMCGALLPAQADVAAVGVYFAGVREENGNWITVKLDGLFRILQNGIEIGRIRSGENTVLLSDLSSVMIDPVPETMPAGWDYSGAPWKATVSSGTTTVVPVMVYASGNDGKTAPLNTLPAEITDQAITDSYATSNGNTEDADPNPESEDETDASAYSADPQTLADRVLPTAPPAVQPTAEPQPEIMGGNGTGVLRIYVFNDGNCNGECGKYEVPVSGIRLFLLTEDAVTTVATSVTDATGEVRFTGLETGRYIIRAYIPENLYFGRKGTKEWLYSSCMDLAADEMQDSEPVSVRSGETTERGIGVTKAIHVSGFCWLESEADGVKKADEQMLPGIRITLTGQKNGLEYETLSKDDGTWIINRVRPGLYTLTAYAPEGMMFTRYSKVGGKNRSIFTTEGVRKASKTLDTNNGYSVEDQNIGFAWSADVNGICFLDENYNGFYDEGEKPLAGVKLAAIKQIRDEQVSVCLSGEDGTFTLSGLRGNTYRIKALLPEDGSDFTRTVSDPLGNHFEARVGRRENYWNDFVIRDAEHRTVNVGAIYPGSVSGTVYMDNDFSATRNGSEKAVNGFEVSLLDAGGHIVATDTTNAKGVYSFKGLTPGTYSLKMIAIPGYAFTKRGEENIILNRNGGEGYSEPFEVQIGQNITGMDAGMILPGTVKGIVFADLNDNGIRDEGEDGLTGVTVRLMSEEGEAFSTVIGKDAGFLFDAVLPGRYCLKYDLPEHAVFAKNVTGGNTITGENGSGCGDWFDFKTGATVNAPVCGALTLGRITGTVFTDHDGTGIMTDEEQPFEGVSMKLIPEDPELRTWDLLTDRNGHFEMTDLHPGDYMLEIVFPEGYVSSRTNHMTLPVTPGMNRQQIDLPVPMGTVWEEQMLGAVIPAEISGRVWLDENNNGLFDEGEQTPAGIQITISDETIGEVFRTLETDREGYFVTDGAMPGEYSVSYQPGQNIAAAKPGDSTFRSEEDRLVMSGIRVDESEIKNDVLLGLIKYTTIGGRIWIDKGEDVEALKGATITLLNGKGEQVDSVTTADNGNYRFEGLMPDTYTIAAVMPEGCVVVEPGDERLNNGLISVAEQVNGRNGESDPIELIMGNDQTEMNIGCVLPGRLGDYCWLDLNGNGWQDSDEPGITGVKIELMRNGNVVAEKVTGDYGFYWFDEVYPAVYTLHVTPPAEIKPTVRKTDIPLLVSVLEETDDNECYSVMFEVKSDTANYNVDMGFVCRKNGVLPAGLNQGKTQDWSR